MTVRSRALALSLLAALLGIVDPLGAQTAKPAAEPQAAQANGRIVATVTALDGELRMPAVEVELRTLDGNMTLARSRTDAIGQVMFPGVPPGRYIIRAQREGFEPSESAAFDLGAGATEQVLVDLRLTFVLPSVDVKATSEPNSPTSSIHPVSASDALSGAQMELQPLEGDDFQSLLPLLPGTVRGADGRLRIKGGQPGTGALQVSSASLNDPSTGDFDLELPGESIDSIEVLSNPFAAEYGRFTTSVTQIRTKRGTNDWQIKPGNLFPRFRGGFTGIRGFEPRLSIRGPIKRDRIFLAQDFQFRYLRTPVKSLPDEPEIGQRSFDSFTRVDAVFSPSHAVTVGAIWFPREVTNPTMFTFRPPEVTPKWTQEGIVIGGHDRLILSDAMVLETTVAARWFEVDVTSQGPDAMVYAPQTQSGRFFNDQERSVSSLQWVEALTISKDWFGQHLFKLGIDMQFAEYDGESFSRVVEARRLDGSLAERTTFTPVSTDQEPSGVELGLFVQDRWRWSERFMFEMGMRMDRDPVIERVNFSPRGGVSVSMLSDGRGILRGGLGKFVLRTPLNLAAFTDFEDRAVERFAADGGPLGPTVFYDNVVAGSLRSPESLVGNVEWNQRFGRHTLFKVNYLRRHGSHEYFLQPDAAAGEIQLASAGESRYWELELTGRYLGSERRDITVSYVHSHSTLDLNTFDQFYGNFRTPLIRPNENSLSPTDVPHRLLVRGTIGMPWKLIFLPVVEIRSGFPWSAVDEFQDYVGPRNRSGRLPVVKTLDFSLVRPIKVLKYRFTGGIRVYNIFGATNSRDVQTNIASPDYGRFYNPIERSIGFVFSTKVM